TRKILQSYTVKIEDVPGMSDIIKQNNYSVDSRHHFDEKQMEKFAQNNITLAKNMNDLKHYASFLNTYFTSSVAVELKDLEKSKENVILSHAFINFLGNGKIQNKTSTYQLKSGESVNNTQLVDVISLTESAFQKEQKAKLIDTVESVDGCPQRKDRKVMIAENIFDLNIDPIKLQALMREIAGINLMNYSNTYDHLVCDVFGLRSNERLKAKLALVRKENLTLNDLIGSTNNMKEPAKKLLGALLIQPYAGIDYSIYKNYFSAIVRGSLVISGLGRPKYVDSEVYNKVLLGEIYPGQAYEEEGGPGVGVGHLRGKEEVLSDIT